MNAGVLCFVREEKKFVVLCLVLSALVGVLKLYVQPSLEKVSASAQVLQDGTEEQGDSSAEPETHDDLRVLQQRLKEDPRAAGLLAAAGTVFTVIFSLGLFVLGSWVFSSRLRQSWQQEGESSDGTQWKILMLVKAAVYFVCASLAVNLLLALFQLTLPERLSENSALLVQTTVVDVLCLVFILSLVREAGGRARDIGLRIRPQNLFKEAAVGVTAYLAIFPVFMGVLLALAAAAQFFSYQPPAHPLVDIFIEEEQKNPGLILYSVILATTVAPVLEEVFFRGFCYKIFKARLGQRAGMFLSAMLFGLVHGNPFAFLPIFILGLGLAYVYEKRGSMTAPVTLHLVHNSVFILFFFLVQKAAGKGGP
ncbi:MAG: CPBP family intramembrane metalloprotease [Candidatus Omnitrophica bacterium]|nr:CPBP family intramembrane metalloprotease [Candidatus Omnitrophota bacterium]